MRTRFHRAVGGEGGLVGAKQKSSQDPPGFLTPALALSSSELPERRSIVSLGLCPPPMGQSRAGASDFLGLNPAHSGVICDHRQLPHP